MRTRRRGEEEREEEERGVEKEERKRRRRGRGRKPKLGMNKARDRGTYLSVERIIERCRIYNQLLIYVPQAYLSPTLWHPLVGEKIWWIAISDSH